MLRIVSQVWGAIDGLLARKSIGAVLVSVGLLRVLLVLLAVLVIFAAPVVQGVTEPLEGDWRFLVSIVSPSLFGMLLFVIPLDLLMLLVFRTAAGDAGRRRNYLRLVWFEGAIWLGMVAAWLPLLLSLLNR